jgi:hypothetical protein
MYSLFPLTLQCLAVVNSIRKFAATHVRKCGISKDNKDIRGRWKGKGRVSDVYDDVELPYPDCKVAEKLVLEDGVSI